MINTFWSLLTWLWWIFTTMSNTQNMLNWSLTNRNDWFSILVVKLFVWLCRLQGWFPPPASARCLAGSSATGRVGETAVVWPTVGSPASIAGLQSTVGRTCGQFHHVHCALPLPQPLSGTYLHPLRVAAQLSACTPTPSISCQIRERGVPVRRGLPAFSFQQGGCGCWPRQVAREERPRENQEGSESRQRGRQPEQAGWIHRGQRACSLTATGENATGWCVRAPRGEKSVCSTAEESVTKWWE